MADTSARISIQSIVKKFVFKFKGSEDDYANYLEHACDCFRELNIHHLPYYTEAKVTVDSLGIVSFPSDMIDFIAIGLPKDGQFWTFTERRDMNTTTTTTLSVEGFDPAYGDGEGFDVPDDCGVNYGAKGAVNEWYYFIDWPERRIYLDGLTSTTVTLRYVSSGIVVGAETYVPIQATRVMDTYLRWMQSQMDDMPLSTQQLRKMEYDEALLWLRKAQLPTLEQFRDALYSVTTGGVPQR